MSALPSHITNFRFWFDDSTLIYSPYALHVAYYDERNEVDVTYAFQDWDKVYAWAQENLNLPFVDPQLRAAERERRAHRWVYDYLDTRATEEEIYQMCQDLAHRCDPHGEPQGNTVVRVLLNRSPAGFQLSQEAILELYRSGSEVFTRTHISAFFATQNPVNIQAKLDAAEPVTDGQEGAEHLFWLEEDQLYDSSIEVVHYCSPAPNLQPFVRTDKRLIELFQQRGVLWLTGDPHAELELVTLQLSPGQDWVFSVDDETGIESVRVVESAT